MTKVGCASILHKRLWNRFLGMCENVIVDMHNCQAESTWCSQENTVATKDSVNCSYHYALREAQFVRVLDITIDLHNYSSELGLESGSTLIFLFEVREKNRTTSISLTITLNSQGDVIFGQLEPASKRLH